MNFNDVKKISAWELLKHLQKKTRRNSQLIRKNSETIQIALKGEYKLELGKLDIGKLQAKNNELIQRNSENLQLHNSLLTFLKAMANTEEVQIGDGMIEIYEKENQSKSVPTYNFDEYFEKTIAGSIAFNSNHPYFCSDDFKEKLLQYYVGIEEYEKCAKLVSRSCL